MSSLCIKKVCLRKQSLFCNLPTSTILIKNINSPNSNDTYKTKMCKHVKPMIELTLNYNHLLSKKYRHCKLKHTSIAHLKILFTQFNKWVKLFRKQSACKKDLLWEVSVCLHLLHYKLKTFLGVLQQKTKYFRGT